MRSQRVTRDDEGAVAIIVALFAIVLFGFAALVVDVGNASDVRAQASSAADVGALAGARELTQWVHVNGPVPDPNLAGVVEDAVAATYQVSAEQWAACDDTVPASMPADTQPTATTACVQYSLSEVKVRVRIPPRKVPSTFGGLFGASSISVSPVAVADSGTLANCAPCVPALGADGQPVGSPSPSPVPTFASPSPTVSPSPTGPPPSAPPSSAPPSAPPSSAPPPSSSPSATCPDPGTYVDTDLAAPGACNLSPGLYVFSDSTFTVAGALAGANVTLVFEGTSTLDVAGSLSLTATAADSSPVADEIPGVALFFDAGDTATFHLGPTFVISGNVYALDATWATNQNDCAGLTDCSVSEGSISVAHTDFANGVVPQVGPFPHIDAHLTQ